MTKTPTCSLQVPTAAGWRNRSCNGSAAPFKTMWTTYGSFVNVEVSYDHLEPHRTPDYKELRFYGENSVTLYRQKRKRNSTALQLLGEHSDVATENDVSVSHEQNVAQRMNSKQESIPIGCIENTENKRRTSVAVMLEIL